MQSVMEEFRDGHKTHPVPEAWLEENPCPANVAKGCKRCWIDYCTSLAVEAIDGKVDRAETN